MQENDVEQVLVVGSPRFQERRRQPLRQHIDAVPDVRLNSTQPFSRILWLIQS
jgi:hypothetical protein